MARKDTSSTWLLEQDPWWNAALLNDPDKAFLLVAKDDHPFASIFVHQTGLDLNLGELSLGSIPVRRYVLTGGLSENAATAAEFVGMLSTLRGQMESSGVVFLQGVRMDEPLQASLDSPELRRLYSVVPRGGRYRRCRIKLGGSLEAYLATLGRATRKDLKKTVRVLKERIGAALEMQVVTTPDELETALPDLRRLSAKTYQARLLGMGVVSGNFVERQLQYGVSRGFGRLDLMRVRGEAIAFQVGCLHKGTFHATQCGYDPAWAELQPGIALLSFIIEDLCRSAPEVGWLDFMHGESLYKMRLSNSFHEESNFLLIPRTARGWSTLIAFQTINGLSSMAGAALAMLRLKAAVRAFLRRYA